MKVLNALSRKNSDDLFNVTGYLLKTLNVNFTRDKLYETVRKHADYPSLLTLKDTFSSFGIHSEAISKAQYSYEDFETPYVASIQKEDWPKAHFTTVVNAENGYIEFLDPISHKIQRMTIGQFEMIDKNVILLLDPSAPKDEENYLENKKRERNKVIIQRTPLLLMCLAFFIAISPVFSQPLNADSWYKLGFAITSLAGLGITSLLIWHEIDAHNPFLKEVCGGAGRKVNCDAVPSSSSVTFMWCALSITVTPYIAFSIYHQWFVIKQWCPLCLGVQGILAVNLFISAMYFSENGVSLENISYYGIIVTLLLGLIFLFFAYIIIPVIQSANDSKDYEQKWKSLKFNPQIFQALLERSEKIFVPTENLGIVLGNPDARHEIVKVCNPYCGPAPMLTQSWKPSYIKIQMLKSVLYLRLMELTTITKRLQSNIYLLFRKFMAVIWSAKP